MIRQYTREDVIHARALVEAYDGNLTQLTSLMVFCCSFRDQLEKMIERMPTHEREVHNGP